MLRRQRGFLAFGLGLICLVCGCGEGNPLGRKPISGTVTLDGAPVPHGNISFQPLQQGGVGSGSAITDGEFSISEEQGLPVGNYQVMIYASDPSIAVLPPGGMPGDDVPTPVELVPPEWNTKTTQKIEVTAEGPHDEYKFEIKTKK